MQTTLHAIRKLHLNETTRTLSFICVLFFLPLLFAGPQLLIGSIVNLLLIAAVRKLSRAKAWPMAFIPSIAAVLHGVIFGSFTIFLVYMMPAIWIGNLILMYAVSHISHKLLSITLGSIIKAVFLFFVAFVLVQNAFLPTIFLKAMGIFQLITALIGGFTLWGIKKLAK